MPNPLNTEGKGAGDPERKPQRKGRFVEIEDKALEQDATLRAFLRDARATMSRRGDGVFISTSQDVDTSLLHRYGIPVPGALIVPTGRGDVAVEIERVRSVIESITRTAREEENTRKEREKADARQIADEEFALRLLALQSHIEAYEKVAREYADSFGAHLVTENDGKIKMVAGRFTFEVLSLTTDYKLPEQVRYERQMPKPEWATDIEYIKRVLNKEIAIAAERARLFPVVHELVRQLEADFAGSYQGGGYQMTLPKNLTFWGVEKTSQEIRFGKHDDAYEWSDAGIAKLKAAVADAKRETSDADEKGWAALKKITMDNLPVTQPHSSNTADTSLQIGEHTIQFGSPKSSLAAYHWALENGAMTQDEFKVREAVKSGAKIKSAISGYGTSPDHMRQITNYGNYLGGVSLGKTEEPLHQLAIHLIAERDERLRSKEVENLSLKVRVYAAESRTKGYTVAEIEGAFDAAIQQALQKVGHYLRPRRGISVTVTRVMTDGKEGHKERAEFGTETEVREYLISLQKEKFIY